MSFPTELVLNNPFLWGLVISFGTIAVSLSWIIANGYEISLKVRPSKRRHDNHVSHDNHTGDVVEDVVVVRSNVPCQSYDSESAGDHIDDASNSSSDSEEDTPEDRASSSRSSQPESSVTASATRVSTADDILGMIGTSEKITSVTSENVDTQSSTKIPVESGMNYTYSGASTAGGYVKADQFGTRACGSTYQPAYPIAEGKVNVSEIMKGRELPISEGSSSGNERHREAGRTMRRFDELPKRQPPPVVRHVQAREHVVDNSGIVNVNARDSFTIAPTGSSSE